MNQNVFHLVNQTWTSPSLDWLMAVMSCFDLWLVPLLLLVIGTFCAGGFRPRAMILCGILILGIGDGVVANQLKQIVNRPRPYQATEGVRVVDLQRAHPRLLALFKPPKVELSRPDVTLPVAGRSFPSAHILNNFCAALLLACFYRRWGWLSFFPAGLVAYSRVYVGSHWPSDALGSIVLALAVAGPLLVLLGWMWRRHGRRFLPNVHARHPELLG